MFNLGGARRNPQKFLPLNVGALLQGELINHTFIERRG